MDKLKKSGMDMDMNIEQMDWVEDNKKVWPPSYKLPSILSKKLNHGTNFLFCFRIGMIVRRSISFKEPPGANSFQTEAFMQIFSKH